MFSSKYYKQLNFLLLSAVILFVSFMANADQKQVFYADFEDGFNASTGALLKLGSDTSVLYDAAGDTNAVRVGPSTDGNSTVSYFIGRYTIGKDGEVNLKFKLPSITDYNTGSIKLFGVKLITDNKNYWDIGLDSRKAIRIRSYGVAGVDLNYGPGVVTSQYLKTLDANLADGWHTMKFTWQETFAEGYVGDYIKREQANIVLYLDGVEVFNQPEAWWALPGAGHITLGSWYNCSNGNIVCSYEAGDKNILIDDVNVVCESVPQKTTELGKGTVTWSYDAENGFDASSGIPDACNLSTGKITNPFDTTGSVYTIFDADKNSNVVKVGNSTTYTGAVGSYLNWSNLDTGVVAPNGRVKCAFKITPNWIKQSGAYCTLITAKYSETNAECFVIGATTRGLPMIKSYNANRNPFGMTHTAAPDNTIVLANGWHTCEFTWQQTVPQAATTAKADLRIYFDGYIAYEAADVNWSVPERLNIGVGSFGAYDKDTGNLTSNWEAGDIGTLIDDVVFEAVPLECGDFGTVYLNGDINKDCAVTMTDVDVMADEWLGCTEPTGIGCIKATLDLASTMNYNAPQSSSITVDGTLTDWSDAAWTDISTDISDQLAVETNSKGVAPAGLPYAGRKIATDVESAVYAVKWDDATDKLYLAVKVVDTQHNFKPFDVADPCVYDRIDVYVQGANTGGEVDALNYATAQRYTVGADGLGGTWKTLAGDPNAGAVQGITAVTTVSGDEILYEVAITPYDSFAGRTGGAVTPTALTNGKVVKFDVTVASRYASTYYDYGMLAANLKQLKWSAIDSWNMVTCNDAVTTCGSWGYKDADTNGDCRVALADFAKLAENWNNCSNPTETECDQYWP